MHILIRYGILSFYVFSSLHLYAQQPYADSLNDHRVRYKEGFLKDPRSPLTMEDLSSLDFFPADSTWKLHCPCTVETDAAPFAMPTYSGTTRSYVHYATARCQWSGIAFQIRIYKNMTYPNNPLYANQLFLPFKDATNDETTYGGGRYINLSTNDIRNGYISIDFNTCYNPWCAYSDGYNCPVPPVENHLPFPVSAGEKSYKGVYKGTKK